MAVKLAWMSEQRKNPILIFEYFALVDFTNIDYSRACERSPKSCCTYESPGKIIIEVFQRG